MWAGVGPGQCRALQPFGAPGLARHDEVTSVTILMEFDGPREGVTWVPSCPFRGRRMVASRSRVHAQSCDSPDSDVVGLRSPLITEIPLERDPSKHLPTLGTLRR
jgi:hypothetical protein